MSSAWATCGWPSTLPGDIDLIVTSVGPDTPCAHEPSPEPEFALLDELFGEHQRPSDDAVVAPELLLDAVHVDRERLAHTCAVGGPVTPSMRPRMIARRPRPLRSWPPMSVPYRIRRSDRARGASGCSVDGDGEVEVVLPRRSPERHAEEAVRRAARRGSSGAGARSRARGVGGRRARRGPSRTWARRCTLVPEPGRTRVHRRGDELLCPAARRARRRWSAGTGARRARRSRRGWTRACARAGTRYTGLTIRAQRTRWASCSS